MVWRAILPEFFRSKLSPPGLRRTPSSRASLEESAGCALRRADEWSAAGLGVHPFRETHRRGSTRARGTSDQSSVTMAPDSSSAAQSWRALRSAWPRVSGTSGSPRRRTMLGAACRVNARMRRKSKSLVKSTYECSRA